MKVHRKTSAHCRVRIRRKQNKPQITSIKHFHIHTR